MKIVQIEANKIHWITPYKTWDDVPPFAPNIVLVEAPNDVREGWVYNEQTGEFWECESKEDEIIVSEQDFVQAEILLNQAEIMAELELQKQALSLLLLRTL